MRPQYKTIWHVGGWNRNYGDLALQASMAERFHAQATEPLNIVALDNQKTWFHPDLISKMNDEADLLLLGGGGYIFHRPEDASHSGWQFNIRLEDIEKIEVPIVFYAIGYNKFPFDNDGFRDVLNGHLLACQKKSALFSVRNNGTREELIRRGLSADKIEVIPDPAMFLSPRLPTLPGLQDHEFAIGLNWAGDRPLHRWGEGGEETELRTLRHIAKGLARLLEKKPGKVMLIPHIVDMDEVRESVLREELGDRLLNLMTEVPGMYPPATAQVNFLAGAYQRMDIVLGMRGHSNIIPFGMGTPTIAIGHHQKNRFFQSEIGQPDLVLDASDSELLEDPDAIASFVGGVVERETLSAELAARLAELDATATDFDRRMLALADAIN